MTKHYCDRCGKEIKDFMAEDPLNKDFRTFGEIKPFGDYDSFQFELCRPCFEKLKEFFCYKFPKKPACMQGYEIKKEGE